MFVDIAHVSPDVMRDVLRVSKAPVISSHSDAFALVPHPRNIPDDVLRLLGEERRRGARELHPRVRRSTSSAWEARKKEARRSIRAAGGHRRRGRQGARGLGEGATPRRAARWPTWRTSSTTSASGRRGPRGHRRGLLRQREALDGARAWQDVTTYPALFAELLRRGWSEEDLLKLAGRNHLRAMRQMERVAAELQKSTAAAVTEGPRSP